MAVVSVLMQGSAPSDVVDGHMVVLQKLRKLGFDDIPRLLPGGELLFAVALLRRYDHVPDDRQGLLELFPEHGFRLLVHQTIRIEHA